MKLTIDLQEELLKIGDRELEEAEQFLALAKEQIKIESEEDEKILENVFPGSINEIHRATQRIDKKYSDRLKYGNRLFTEAQIKELCIKYNLRFLSTKYYNGHIDAEVPAKIKEFKSKEFALNYQFSYNDDFNYYIAAPKKSFNLEKKPKDPLLFAKLYNGDYYLIHKWGNDLSIFRRISSIFNQSIANYMIGSWIILLITMLITNYKYSYLTINGSNPGWHYIWMIFCMSAGWVVIMGISNALVDDFTREGRFIRDKEDTWNEPFK